MNLSQFDRRPAAVMCLVAFTLLASLSMSTVRAQVDGTPTPPSSRDVDIVGGQNADPGEFPHQVLVYAGPFMCGGSLIHQEWVLTAAHCVFDQNDNAIPVSQISVVLGEYNINQNDGNEQNFNVTASIPHPQYDPVSADSDVALLKLDGAANLSASNVGIIRLNTQTATQTGTTAVVTGWGALQEGGSGADVLQKVSVPIVSDQQCQNSYPGQTTNNMFCAGFQQGGKDSCQGDSGGPLIVPDGNGGWMQAGIVSWGFGCAQAGFYGVYARVANYISWMEQTTGLKLSSNSSTPPTPTPVTPTPMPTATPVQTPNPGSGELEFIYLPFVSR